MTENVVPLPTLDWTRLMVAGGVTFVVCGVQLAWVEDLRWKNVWGGLSLFGLGGFAVAMAMDGVAKGRLKLQHNTLYRDKTPRLFWAITGLIFLAGCVVVVAGIWALFFKD